MTQTENITILRVGTDEAVRNIQDLKTNISELKKQLADLDIGSEEYNKTLEELNVNQNALKNAMHYTTSETKSAEEAMNGIATAAAGAGESYNALVNRMKTLREEWRSTDDVAHRNELGKQINEINQKLKDLDASTGSFKRNVGDYEGAIKRAGNAFSATAGQARAAIGPLKAVKAGFDALKNNAVVAVLGLVAAALAKIISSLKSSEENMNRVSLAMSTFKGAADIFNNIVQTLGKGVAWLAEKISNLALVVFPKLREAAELRMEIAEREIELSKVQRDAVVANAKDELAAARLRNEAADSEGKTIEERKAALKSAIALQERISDREVDIAERELEILKLRSKTVKNSKEQNDALAQAEARVYDAKKQRYTSTYRLQRQLLSLDKEEAAEALRTQKEREKAEQKALQTNIDYWKQRLTLEKNGSFEEYTTQLTILDAETELKRAKIRAEIKDVEERNAALLLLDKTYLEETFKLANEYADKQIANERLQIENRMNTYREGSTAFLAAQIELRQFEYNTLKQLDKENDDEFFARKLEAEKAYMDAKRALLAKQVSDMQLYAGAVTGVLGSVADAYEALNSEDEKAAEQTKGIRIASAVIDTIAGAIGAYMNAVKTIPDPITGQIIGAANAAAVVAAGTTNIAKIRSTNISSGAASSASSLSAFTTPTVSRSVPQTTIVRGAQDEQVLNQIGKPSRVYILQSDIEAASKASKARVSESSFN